MDIVRDLILTLQATWDYILTADYLERPAHARHILGVAKLRVQVFLCLVLANELFVYESVDITGCVVNTQSSSTHGWMSGLNAGSSTWLLLLEVTVVGHLINTWKHLLLLPLFGRHLS